MPAVDGMTPLPASLTLRDATAVLDSLRQSFVAGSGDVWRVDATPVTQLDTSALAVLLECARIAAAGKRKFQIVGAPARLSDLAHLYGVDGLLGVTPPPVPTQGEPVAPLIEPRVDPSAPAPQN
jgi:phospholipid transport system transporter-binding protein